MVGGADDGRLHAHCRARGARHQTYEKGGEVLYEGVLHEDTREAMEDEHGKLIPAGTVRVAPVNLYKDRRSL